LVVDTEVILLLEQDQMVAMAVLVVVPLGALLVLGQLVKQRRVKAIMVV